MTYSLSTIHPLRTDRQTDRRTDDRHDWDNNGTINAYSIAVSASKLCTVQAW